MDDLFERVLHHIEGTEVQIQGCNTNDGDRGFAIESFGPDRWIERAALGRVMAIDLLAIILFAIRDAFDLQNERRIVEGWAAELRKAACSGETLARDPITLLKLETLPEGWEWLVSIEDADKFVATRGMGWACSERVAYLLESCRNAGTRYLDAKTGEVLLQYWMAGYQPNQPSLAMPAKAPSSDWEVKNPERFQGYSEALYKVLTDARANGETRPTARRVLERFSANKPAEVAKVHPGEGLDYYTADFQTTKHAGLHAIQSSIARMTVKKPR